MSCGKPWITSWRMPRRSGRRRGRPELVGQVAALGRGVEGVALGVKSEGESDLDRLAKHLGLDDAFIALEDGEHLAGDRGLAGLFQQSATLGTGESSHDESAFSLPA